MTYTNMNDFSEKMLAIDTSPATDEQLEAEQAELEARLGKALGAGYTSGTWEQRPGPQPRDPDYLYRVFLSRCGHSRG